MEAAKSESKATSPPPAPLLLNKDTTIEPWSPKLVLTAKADAKMEVKGDADGDSHYRDIAAAKTLEGP